MSEPFATVGTLYRLKVDWFRPDTDRVFEEVTINIEAGTKAYIDKWDELSPYANTRKCFETGLAAALTPGDTK